jgi:gliding motility-associated-like protein
MRKREYIILIICSLITLPFSSPAQDPLPPTIRFVTVDTLTGNVIIDWKNGSPAGVKKYVVYEGREGSDPLVADPIDTLDVASTSYIHNSNAAASRPVAYTVASIYADDTSPLADYHFTIHASVRYDSCRSSLIIDWTPYIGWNDDLIAYNVYIRAGTGEVFKIPSLSPSIRSYKFKDVIPYTEYWVLIEAENRDFLSSMSNRVSLVTNRAIPPSYINADYATVTGDKSVQLSFSFDPVTQVNDFVLFFGRSIDNIIDPVAEFNNVTSGSINYTHQVFSVKKKNYYQLAAVDQCSEKNPLKKSNVASNIILEASESELIVNLEWGDYEEWPAGVKYYNVYRVTNGTNTEKIDSLKFGANSLSDNLEFLRDGLELVNDKVCYFIEAEENDDNIYGIKGYSRSNTVCIFLEPEIFMANAFTPDGNGQNDEIKPILTFRPDEYYFAVYDRWGSIVFETTDIDEYWNGDINNKKDAPPGVYIYYLKITTSGNIIKEKKGTITLFYP